jgi:hypothetical protein
MSNASIAPAEIAMVVHKRNKTRFGEGAAEGLESMFLHARITMGERDGRKLSDSF